MESIKILHTGDLHLCSPMNNMGERAIERKRELLETFSNIIKLAKSEDADALLIAGDFFENGKPDDDTLQFVYNEFEKISNIKVFVVLGNPDYCLDCKFPDNVHLVGNYIEKVMRG